MSTRAGDAAIADAGDVPRVPWRAFLNDFQRAWRENAAGKAQHVTMVGPTSQGKSTLAFALLKERARLRGSSIVAFGTKPKDPTLSHVGWPILRTWPPGYGQDQVIYWPKFGDVRSAAIRQRRAFEPVLAEIFADGNRTIYVDEAFYFTQLRLDTIMKQFWQAGRGNNLIVMAGTQRPVDVPRAMFSECSWFFAFKTADEDELRRVGQIGGTDSARIRENMRALAPHEFLCVQTRTGVMVRSKVAR